MQAHQGTWSQRTDVVPGLEKLETDLQPINEPLFYTAMKQTHGNIT